LKKGLEPKGFYIAEYDPAIEGKDSFPLPADMIVCTDVFEHIEEECIDEVLRHIQSLMRKAGFFTVSIVPAKKQLGDGRNAHILLRSSKWWLAKLMEYFDVVEWSAASSNEIIAFVHPISVNHE
jgi:2-polyprenyl-3-methyl-5-hydroxy-6-metoxy-1,4-benzoquinol methylase